MELFESYDRRIDKILGVLKEYGIESVEECKEICASAGIDPYATVKEIQPIAFENAGWAYTVGAAIAIKQNCRTAVDAAKAIGIGLQAFCIPGSVAEDRKVGRGHGNLASMLLQDSTSCFCFLAGHESFAAAEGAIGIVRNANKARKVPLKVILNGLGKDAAQIIPVSTALRTYRRSSTIRQANSISYGKSPIPRRNEQTSVASAPMTFAKALLSCITPA